MENGRSSDEQDEYRELIEELKEENENLSANIRNTLSFWEHSRFLLLLKHCDHDLPRLGIVNAF